MCGGQLHEHDLLQKAVQGWRAVVIHMASRRAQLQQAALASAERAVRKGCQAATGDMLHQLSDQHNNVQSAREMLQLPYAVCQHRRQGDAQRPNTQLLTFNTSQQVLGRRHAESCGTPDQPTSLEHANRSTLPGCSGNSQARIASTHHAVRLLTQAMRTWQAATTQAVALLFQQHELKAQTNQQLLQVCACPVLPSVLHIPPVTLHTHHVSRASLFVTTLIMCHRITCYVTILIMCHRVTCFVTTLIMCHRVTYFVTSQL